MRFPVYGEQKRMDVLKLARQKMEQRDRAISTIQQRRCQEQDRLLAQNALRNALSHIPLQEEQPNRSRRMSALKGYCENRIWQKTDRKTIAATIAAAKKFDFINRKKGERSGPLKIGVEVLEFFAKQHLNYRTGRLDPALLTICAGIKRSKGAVVSALAALRKHGFLTWIRRITYNGDRVQQTSNAYCIILPEAALKFLPHWIKKAPSPDDAGLDKSIKLDSIKTWINSLTGLDHIKESALFKGADSDLIDSLFRLKQAGIHASLSSSQKP